MGPRAFIHCSSSDHLHPLNSQKLVSVLANHREGPCPTHCLWNVQVHERVVSWANDCVADGQCLPGTRLLFFVLGALLKSALDPILLGKLAVAFVPLRSMLQHRVSAKFPEWGTQTSCFECPPCGNNNIAPWLLRSSASPIQTRSRLVPYSSAQGGGPLEKLNGHCCCWQAGCGAK